MIRAEISAREVFVNDLLREIVDSKVDTLETRLGCLEAQSPLNVRLVWEGSQCRCRLTLKVGAVGTLTASGEHIASDIAVDLAFAALFRQVERVRGEQALRRRAA